MPKYKPYKQVIQGLTNYDKRRAYFLEDTNWTTCQQLNGLKLEKLRFTPFIRIAIEVESYTNKLLGHPNTMEWQIIQYKRLNEHDQPSSLESTPSDVMEYLKQQAWQIKQQSKGFKL